MGQSSNIIKFRRPPANYPDGFRAHRELFAETRQAIIDVACVVSAFVLVSTATIGIMGIFFVFGCLLTFE